MSSVQKNRTLLVIIFIAFIVRIFVSLWSFQFRENTDVLRYRDWSKIAYLHSLQDTYNTQYISFGTLGNNQPPGSVYVLSSAFRAYMLFAKGYVSIVGGGTLHDQMNAWLNGPVLSMFLRLPSILADLCIGFMIFKITSTFMKKSWSMVSAIVYLFNPVVLYNSAFWGQMDSVVNLWFILSLYFILAKKTWISMVCFAFSLFTKLSLLPMLPICILLWWIQMKKSYTRFFMASVITGIILFVCTLPISRIPWVWFVEFIQKNGAGEMQDITVYAFNAWWFIFHPLITFGQMESLWEFSQITLLYAPGSYEKFIGVPLFYWGIIIFLLLSIPLFRMVLKSKWNIVHILISMSLFACISFLIFPQMHERYLYPLFPLLAMLVCVKKKYCIFYIVFSLLNFINIYTVWHPFYFPVLPAWFIGSRLTQWGMSAVMVLLVGYWYMDELYVYEKNK